MKPDRKKLGWDFQVGTLIWVVATLLWLFFPEFGQGSIWRGPMHLFVLIWWPLVAVQIFLNRR